jgi:hypothetical protein
MAYADSSNAARPCLTAKDAEATRIEERNYVWSEEVDASGRRRYIVAPIGTMFRVLLRQDGRSQRLGGLRLHCVLIPPPPRPPARTHTGFVLQASARGRWPGGGARGGALLRGEPRARPSMFRVSAGLRR